MRIFLFCALLVLAACSSEPESEAPSAGEVNVSVNRDLRPLPVSEITIGTAGASSGSASATGSTAATSAVRSSNASVQRVFSEFNARQTSSGIVLTLPENVLFGFDESTLRPEAQTALAKIQDVLAEYPEAPIEIVGHTDSRGTEAYNQDLSERRAASVVAWLRERGTPASRLSASGRGQAEPVAPNEGPGGADNPEGRQQNRRVEVLLRGVTGAAEAPASGQTGGQPTSTIQTSPAP